MHTSPTTTITTATKARRHIKMASPKKSRSIRAENFDLWLGTKDPLRSLAGCRRAYRRPGCSIANAWLMRTIPLPPCGSLDPSLFGDIWSWWLCRLGVGFDFWKGWVCVLVLIGSRSVLLDCLFWRDRFVNLYTALYVYECFGKYVIFFNSYGNVIGPSTDCEMKNRTMFCNEARLNRNLG